MEIEPMKFISEGLPLISSTGKSAKDIRLRDGGIESSFVD